MGTGLVEPALCPVHRPNLPVLSPGQHRSRNGNPDQTEPHQVSHHVLSPVPFIPLPMPAAFWSYSSRKARTTIKPIWAALAAKSAVNWPHPHPWANTLERTHATLRWLVATPPALSGTYKLCRCMTGYVVLL